MYAILSHMVLFDCKVCKERFPAFHPAYRPPSRLFNEIEVLKRGATGVATCNTEVSSWDDVPELQEELVAGCYGGTCLRCQLDMDKQLAVQGGDASNAAVVPRRSELNHMDPCFRFPVDDLKELFDGATVVEAMLVALEHMQVNFVTVARGLRKFRRSSHRILRHSLQGRA